jgi:hypothetical protein
MRSQEFLSEAEQCRSRARTVSPAERELLVRIAETFEEMASAAEARRTVEETRCW